MSSFGQGWLGGNNELRTFTIHPSAKPKTYQIPAGVFGLLRQDYLRISCMSQKTPTCSSQSLRMFSLLELTQEMHWGGNPRWWRR